MNQASHTFAGLSVISFIPNSVDACATTATTSAPPQLGFFQIFNFRIVKKTNSLIICFLALLLAKNVAADHVPAGQLVAWGPGMTGTVVPPADLGAVEDIWTTYGTVIARRSDGSLYAWGANDPSKNIPINVGDVTDLTGTGGCSNRILALRTDGTIIAWGNGCYSEPSPLPTNIKKIALGANGAFHVVGKVDDSIQAWGFQSGVSGAPASVLGVRSIAKAQDYVVAAGSDGSLTAWGGGSNPPTNATPARKLVAGEYHVISLKENGTLVSWGESFTCPTGVFIDVSTFRNTSVALRADGTLAVWGIQAADLTPPLGYRFAKAVVGLNLQDYKPFIVAITIPVDTDGDGVFDAQDNCVNIANPSQADCDNDGIGDACEIAAGALDADLNGVPDGCEGDCNVNGQLDYLDIAAGAADCNGNLMIDSCEDGSGIYRNSGNLGNIGSGVPRSVTFATLPAAVSSVTLEVSARANLSATNRFLIMKLNGGASTYLFQTTGTDCPSTLNTYSRTFTASEFNTLTTSGSLAVTFTAPGTVNAASCGSDALLQVRLAYEQSFNDCDNDGLRDFCAIASGAVKDCNRNGIPDSCDIATGFAKDCNGNGIPDSCDIATGLAPDCNSNGIPDSCDPDTDGDGIIDACDPCPNVAGPCNGCPLNVCGDCGTAADADGDGTANCIDNDDDNDGVVDSMDAFPLDASESVDTDGDGQGDNADQDDDGDGTDDASDGCPFDATKSAPGQCGCGNPDTDTDGDGVADCVDNCPAVANPSQTDCDGNGIGEACETFTDCNANGIPDSCDLASGFAQDCNGNGKPDSCDLAVSGSPYPGAVQWTVASGGNGHWYYLLHTSPSETSESLFQRAVDLGGHTATLTSSAENIFCFSITNGNTLGLGVTIGVRKQVGNNQGTWVTGEPWSFTNWHSGEGWNSGERYVGLNPNWGGEWQDTDLTPSQYSLVEWEISLPTESDCNANGIPDSCEIANGGDCNNNGLLDACETFDQTTPDCNNNGVPDSCDIESRFARDCNLNNVPDSCDIAAGALDENSDGRIDACNYAVGDFDLSNEVDPADLSFLLLFFGEENPPFGDLDGSGVCDSADLSYCLLNFGPLE